MNGYPLGYCEKGARLRLKASDARQLWQLAARTFEFWSRKEDETRDRLAQHCQVCHDCLNRNVPQQPPRVFDGESIQKLEASLAGAF